MLDQSQGHTLLQNGPWCLGTIPYPKSSFTKWVLFPKQILYKMASKVLQAKFDQNLAKMFKKQPLYKKGSVRPHWGTKPIVLYKKSFCTGLKATHFVEGIGRGILRVSNISQTGECEYAQHGGWNLTGNMSQTRLSDQKENTSWRSLENIDTYFSIESYIFILHSCYSAIRNYETKVQTFFFRSNMQSPKVERLANGWVIRDPSFASLGS